MAARAVYDATHGWWLRGLYGYRSVRSGGRQMISFGCLIEGSRRKDLY